MAATATATAESKLLTAREAAEYLNIKVQTLAKWRCEGTHVIPFTRVGRAVRYRLADLEAWLASRTVAAGS